MGINAKLRRDVHSPDFHLLSQLVWIAVDLTYYHSHTIEQRYWPLLPHLGLRFGGVVSGIKISPNLTVNNGGRCSSSVRILRV